MSKYQIYDESLPDIQKFRSRKDINKDRKYKIYVVIDPRENTVRYVGATKSPNYRCKDYRTPSAIRAQKHSRKVNEWTLELLSLGLKPIFKIIDSANHYDWERIEILYIQYFKERGDLLNTHKGGSMSKVRNSSMAKFEHDKRNAALHEYAVKKKAKELEEMNKWFNTNNSFDIVPPRK